MENGYLVHHGILGMKWGVRRSPAQLSRARGKSGEDSDGGGSKKSSKQSSSGKGSSSTSSKKTLSDEELKARIARLELEKKYKELTTSLNPPEQPSAAKKFVADVITDVGKKTIVNLGTQAVNHYVGNYLNKMAGVSSSDVDNRVVNPQKGQADKK